MSTKTITPPVKLEWDVAHDGVYAPTQGNRLVISKQHGFDGCDVPAVEEMVRRYNAHDELVTAAVDAHKLLFALARGYPDIAADTRILRVRKQLIVAFQKARTT